MTFDERELIGGAACLDFVNTLGGVRGGVTEEKLTDYEALLDWSTAAQARASPAMRRLREEASRAPAEARRVYKRAVLLREALYDALILSMKGRKPGARDFKIINDELATAAAQRRLAPIAGGWRLEHEAEGERLDAPLWPVSESAASLLVSDELARLRQCASETCGWLFLDRSKNASRRWCDMKGCGNRAKARRFRAG
ncbi:MAG: CGNR zinc finger domain-containing protein [Parvularculaceae bacterium]